MSKSFRIKISGRGADTDAPTVDDLLNQVRDYFDLLKEIEVAMSDDHSVALEWHLVTAKRESPLDMGFEAFPRAYAVNIDDRASAVIGATARGLDLLRNKPQRPDFFTDAALAKAEKIFERVTKGLSMTEIQNGDDLPSTEITVNVARAAVRNVNGILHPSGGGPYSELGSLEGYFHSAEKDGFGRNLLFVRHRLTGDSIKCVVTDAAVPKLAGHEIKEIWRARRLLVIGMIYYKSLGKISYVDTNDIQFFRTAAELPDVSQIIDTNFTGGLSSKEYLDQLRNGKPH